MDEIQARLQETLQNCLKAYVAWVNNKKDAKSQEDLHIAIHESRKVYSRLEIELAISERDQMTSKPLPIPSHRSVRGNSAIMEGDDDEGQSYGNGGGSSSLNPKRRRMPQQQQGHRSSQGGGNPNNGGRNHNQGGNTGAGASLSNNLNPSSSNPPPATSSGQEG